METPTMRIPRWVPPDFAAVESAYGAAGTATVTSALAALSTYVADFGWLSSVTAIADIETIPDSACVTTDDDGNTVPAGDCELAARIYAARALADAGDTAAAELLPTTDTVVSPGPPPTATLTSLYATADSDDRTAALQALSAYVSSRGWLSGVSAVGDIANAPERGCGAPGGDCEPAARLHALRALAAAVHPDAPDAVFALVSESLRVDAAGAWSVAP